MGRAMGDVVSLRPGAGGGGLLEVREVSKNFGGLEAVRRLSMRVEPGEIVGVMGPNGAGKSTVLDLIAGQQRVSAGRILFEGRDLTPLPQYRRVRAGLVRVLQHATHLERATVEENVSLGFAARGGRPRILDRLFLRSGAPSPSTRLPGLEILRRVGFDARADVLPVALNHWHRRLLGVARALASDPRLLLLDEPLAGLSHAEMDRFTALVRGLRDDAGMTFVLVEHRIDALLRLCDRVIVLHRGAKIADDVPERITEDRQVRDVYLGDDPWPS